VLKDKPLASNGGSATYWQPVFHWSFAGIPRQRDPTQSVTKGHGRQLWTFPSAGVAFPNFVMLEAPTGVFLVPKAKFSDGTLHP